MNTGVSATIRACLRPTMLAVLTLGPVAAPTYGQPPSPAAPQPAILQSATVAGNGGTVTIDLRASAPLPSPTAGTATNPARIFLDFPGVRPASTSLRTRGTGDVLRVRAALNSAQPLLTRVVVELAREAAFEVDVTGRDQGLVRIVVTGGAPETRPSPIEALEQPPRTAARPPVRTEPSPATPPATVVESTPAVTTPAATTPPLVAPPSMTTRAIATPAPTTPAATAAAAAPSQAPPPAPLPAAPSPRPASPPAVNDRAPATAPTAPAATRDPPPGSSAVAAAKPAITRPPGWTPLPAADARKYRTSALEPIRRLQAMRPLVASIDSRSVLAAASLEHGTRELGAIRKKLEGVQPPRSVKPVHDMLLRACGLAQQAIAIRTSASAGAPAEWNAASAAAGALMLLDRALADLDMEGSK